MNQKKFETLMAAAESVGGDYAKGYQRGLRRHHHGESFGTKEEHKQWLSLSDHRQELGDGYRDGFAGKPPRGFHGNIGNLNAQGDLPANSTLQMRLNSQLKSSYVKQAQKEGLKLTEWVLKTLNEKVAESGEKNNG